MASSFGKIFNVTTFGESHGKELGVVIEGIPAGLSVSEADISFELKFRKTGNYLVSGRRENDLPRIASGTFNGKTTGAPLTVIFENVDSISSLYGEVSHKPRPGHADLAYIKRYGLENWDYRGGGRASARETISRVAAGAVAKKLLMFFPTYVAGYLKGIGPKQVLGYVDAADIQESKKFQTRSLDSTTDREFTELILDAMKKGDSYGGLVEAVAINPPEGLGEPVFDKLKADLAKAVLSIPAVTGFEYGLGFEASRMKGSDASDEICLKADGSLGLRKNLSGGMLGGISTGETLRIRCSFKPTSSIRIPSRTIDLNDMQPTEISVKGRHDPVVAVRGVSVVEAMMAIVLVDHSMRSGKIPVLKLEKEQSELIERRWKEYIARCS